MTARADAARRLNSIKGADASRTHGLRNTPEYGVWSGMIGRCTRPSDSGYPFYGARGITVCDRWRSSFANFIADMGRRPSPKHSIDRISGAGNYEPSNCRWATRAEQHRNRRTTIFLTVNGISRSLVEWCELTGLEYSTIEMRVRRGWSHERAISPPKFRRKRVDVPEAAE